MMFSLPFLYILYLECAHRRNGAFIFVRKKCSEMYIEINSPWKRCDGGPVCQLVASANGLLTHASFPAPTDIVLLLALVLGDILTFYQEHGKINYRHIVAARMRCFFEGGTHLNSIVPQSKLYEVLIEMCSTSGVPYQLNVSLLCILVYW